MRNYSKNTGLLLIALCFTAVACNEVEYEPTGAGDAHIITLVTATDTIYGIGLHAYTYSEFSQVKAFCVGEPDKIFTLAPFNGYTNDLSYETPQNQMTQDLPPLGEYTFEATFPKGEFITMTDLVASDIVLPPVITQCEFNNENDNIIVSWDEVIGSEVLNVKLYTLDGEMIFISPAINPDLVIYTFGTSTSGWMTNDLPEPGEKYIVEISSFIFEPISGGSLNIQATGRIKKEITWGN